MLDILLSIAEDLALLGILAGAAILFITGIGSKIVSEVEDFANEIADDITGGLNHPVDPNNLPNSTYEVFRLACQNAGGTFIDKGDHQYCVRNTTYLERF